MVDESGMQFLSSHGKTKSGNDVIFSWLARYQNAAAAGADAVMIGSLFAGTDETPGKLIKKNGKFFKNFRGMGSVGAMNKGSADRYFQKKQSDSSKYVPEGIEGRVEFKGSVEKILYQLQGGLRSSMGYIGAKNLAEIPPKAFRKSSKNICEKSKDKELFSGEL